MKFLSIAAAAAVALSGFASAAAAQDYEAKKRENVTTQGIWLLKVHYGKGEEFDARMKMMNEVRQSLGLAPAAIHHIVAGPYDTMVVAPMEEGMATMDWENTPTGARMDAAMAAKMGGKEAYEAWQKKWPEITERPVVWYSHQHQ